MEMSSLKLTMEQKMIVASRLDGISFWEIDEKKYRFITDEIILATASISGAALPETEILAKYLSDEIVRFILDFGYEDYTVAEVIGAVRLNMSAVIRNPLGENLRQIDLPSRVCVAFLAAVLNNYRIIRNGVDRLIENKINGY